MPAPSASSARRRFDDALRFSTKVNEVLGAYDVPHRLRDEPATLIGRLNHTFMLLITVGAFDAFLTERCQELGIRPHDKDPRCVSFRDRLIDLRPDCVGEAEWELRVDDAYDLYYEARTLWMHGAGMPDPIRRPVKDAGLFDIDENGRHWVTVNLWSGCVCALRGLADGCR